MKKLFTSVLFALFALSVFAQNATSNLTSFNSLVKMRPNKMVFLLFIMMMPQVK